jgi:putative ABC transport system permease protein
MIDYFVNAFRNLFRKKIRSVLTIAGIVIGVMSIMLISMISDIGTAAIEEELSGMGAGGILISSNSKKKNVSLSTPQLELIEENQSVQTAVPLMVQYSTVKMKQQTEECVIWGTDQNIADIISMEVLHGRFITQYDIDMLSAVCVVDESYALNVYKRSNIVGKKIQVLLGGSYQTLEVIGVIKSGGNILQSLMGNMVPCFTYVPYSTMQTLSKQSDFGQILVKIKDENDTQTESDGLVKQLNDEYGVKNAVKAEDLNQQMEMIESILQIVTMILTVIAGISLLVSGLSIMTVMLVSVSERTREIGIKKSIGASRGVILIEFITESFLVTLLGGVIGVALGIFFAWIGCLVFGISVIINWKTILWCILFAVGTGVLFGVYPAFKASALKPVDALRHE